MLVLEDGPWNILEHLRELTGIKRVDEDTIYYPSWNFLHCVWCTSVWTSVLMWLLWQVVGWVVWMLAMSAIACLIEEWGSSDGKS